jgi:hypothetical protein
MPIEVKASIWTLLLLCVLQIAAVVIAVQYPVVGQMENGVGFRDPWIPTWSTFSCASIPIAIINLVIAALAIPVVSRKQGCTQRRDVCLLCFVVIADVCFIAFAFLLSLFSQLGFVSPPGGS